MTHEEAFLQAILENPGDDLPRLAYADWLDDNGRPECAEFIRLECRLRDMPETSQKGRRPRQRLTVLAGRMDVRWLARVCRVHLESGPWHEHPRRQQLNVAGPFYTCGGCLACGAPEHEAPDLLAELGPGNRTTYFVRQPRTAEEIERACRAAQVCCVDDVRYGGTDPKIIARLGNDPLYCDHLLLASSPRLVSAPARIFYDPVGPAAIETHVVGTRVRSAADLLAWVCGSGRRPGPEGLFAATFVIGENGELLLEDRHSEHAACAGGGPVRSAGEMVFLVEGDCVEVSETSNQSTVYCPEPESWPAVAVVLARIGVAHPGRFTVEAVFRRCEGCGERNVIRDGWFVCGVCGANLPAEWNFG